MIPNVRSFLIFLLGADNLSIDAIRSIKEAEEKAEQMIRQASAEARQIIADAEKQSVKLVEQAVEEAEAKARDILAEAEKEAEVEIEQLKKGIMQENLIIKEQASKKIKNAVDIIIGRIVKVHVNS